MPCLAARAFRSSYRARLSDTACPDLPWRRVQRVGYPGQVLPCVLRVWVLAAQESLTVMA